MKILFLYNNEIAIELFEWIRSLGHETIYWSEKLDADWCSEMQFDLAVSYTYRFIIKQEVIDALGKNVVNLHNSILPFNRGADPNMWSIIDGTPRGVTLHYVDAGLDTGDIIAQKFVPYYGEDATLASTYKDLDRTAKKLFKDAFTYYPFWNDMRKKACGQGSFHRSADAEGYKRLIETGASYDIKVSELEALISKTR